ncbi:MAG: radical SAM protein [Methanoregula sp.]|nr:radical SAM protein [Methanoregula sp.]
MSVLNLAGFLARSDANGPGTRAVIWVQGCPIRCRGCFNKASWSFSSGITVSANELADRILSIAGIEGVTFSGGEPFAQADALASVGEQVQQGRLTVITYTGYTYEQLIAHPDPGCNRLLRITDLLIAGPYMKNLACSDPYIGSSNQQVIPLTGRVLPESPNEERAVETIEFSITPDGTVTTTGFPKPLMVRQITSRCRGV